MTQTHDQKVQRKWVKQDLHDGSNECTLYIDGHVACAVRLRGRGAEVTSPLNSPALVARGQGMFDRLDAAIEWCEAQTWDVHAAPKTQRVSCTACHAKGEHFFEAGRWHCANCHAAEDSSKRCPGCMPVIAANGKSNSVHVDGVSVVPVLHPSLPDQSSVVLPTASLPRSEQPFDKIERPAHYNFSKLEPIDVIEVWQLGFCLGNVIKYIARAGRKDVTRTLEDLKKSRWYLDREIARRESEMKP